MMTSQSSLAVTSPAPLSAAHVVAGTGRFPTTEELNRVLDVIITVAVRIDAEQHRFR